ncbi:MAG: DUF4349 domain-containing protein, partial [Treponema sp.]|nr:DUF4349 domain-containing protein [Treponema sp.]
MKGAKRTAVILLIGFVLIGFLSFCSVKGGSGGFTAAKDSMTVNAEYQVASDTAGGGFDGGGGIGPEVSRKLIRNAELRVRVNSLEDAGQAVTATLEQHKGYAAYYTVYDHSRHYTLKVPAASYDRVLTGLSGMGKVLFRSERVEDATIRFYDLEGRLRTKEALLKTFQSYLGQAKTIDEIMTVEKRIAELQQEIEWTG